MNRVFHTQLRDERERRGWSRNYVAEQLEVDVATIGRWERGERLPYPHYRQRICALFELSALEMGLYTEPVEESLPLEESTEAVPTFDTPKQEHSTQKQEGHIDEQLFSPRRKFLLALGGIGAIALLGGARMIASHTYPRQAISSQPAPTLKLLSHLNDPNTPNWINNLAWSPDGNLLAVANNISMVTLWNIAKGAIINNYPTMGQWVNDVTWSPTNRIAAATADANNLTGAIQIWASSDAHSPIHTLHREYSQRTVLWSPNGEYLAFAGHQTMVEIWGPISNPVSSYLYADQQCIGINRVKWPSDATHLAAAADDGDVYVWEVATGNLKTVYKGHTKRVVDIAWLPHGYHIASASVDCTVQIWDAMNGQPIITYREHTGEVHGVDWSPDGKYVVSAGYDNTAQVWNALTGQRITTYGGRSCGVLCVLWSSDGQTIALGSKQKGIEIWQAPA
jgi:WD40 repeat protein